MRNKRVFILTVCFLAGWFLAAEPYATLTYAEGNSFTLIRANKPLVYKVSSADVFGMEIKQGDIVQTAASTFLEISIHPISASVQIAENTSFKCDGDVTGTKSTGELYYGRVRAKVSRLSGDSSYRISSPSLVAGVRGTDFGLDVLVQRAVKDASGTTASPVLHRVFCFDGSVLVSDPLAAGSAVATPVILVSGEMVEKVVIAQTETVPSLVPLKKNNIAEEVRTFWRNKKSVGYIAPASALIETPADSYTEGGYTITNRTYPEENERPEAKRNLKLPSATAFILVGLGTVLCVGTAIYADSVDADSWFITPGYTAGIVLIGSGSILGITSLLFD